MGKNIFIIFTLAMCLLGCSKETPTTVRSMYYWSTEFGLDSCKSSFLAEHNIKKMYIRFFDVVMGEDGQARPNATIRFSSAVPKGMDIVPVVFIVNECMKRNTEGLAERILTRILQMDETNDISGVKEIQIDCDWTNGTHDNFFKFMDELCKMAHRDGIKVSVTIRLHQLGQTPPPADKGILMMYNTGDFTDLSCEKPILDMNDAAPYIKNLADFKLPLSTAYPVFGWNILFRDKQFVGIMHADDDLPVLPGDTIVSRQPTMEDILDARDAVERKRKEANDEIILFDLNNKNINKYNSNDYEKIFNR